MVLENRIKKLEKACATATDKDRELLQKLDAGEIDFREFFDSASGDAKKLVWEEILFGKEGE